MQKSSILWVLSATAAFAPNSFAATLTWPNLSGIGICRGLLQECVDEAAVGDVIEIGPDDATAADRYTAVAQSIYISKGLTLKAAQGIDAVFTYSFGPAITLDPATASTERVVLEGLNLLNGGLYIPMNTTGAKEFIISKLRINATGAYAINFSNAANMGHRLEIKDSVLTVDRADSSNAFGIIIFNGSSVASTVSNITISNNQIANRRGMDAAIAIHNGGASSSIPGAITIERNFIFGNAFNRGISINLPNPLIETPVKLFNNVITGQSSFSPTIGVGGDNLAVQVYNNTVVDNFAGVSIFSAPGVSSNSWAEIRSNIVAFTRNGGLSIDTSGTGISASNNNNLVFANSADSFIAGAGTLTLDPMLESMTFPNLGSSPAVDQGNGGAIGIIGWVDASGERRLINDIDIGAYEYTNDRSTTQTSATGNIVPGTNQLAIDALPNLTSTDRLIATSQRTGNSVQELSQNLGIGLDTLSTPFRWNTLYQNPSVNMNIGRRFNLLVVNTAYPSRSYALHANGPGNISGDSSTLSFSAIDAAPTAVFFATPMMTNISGGAYHDHPITAAYDSASMSWSLRNEDSQAMETDVRFNLIAAYHLSPNGFRASVSGDAVGASNEIMLSHPLLDNNPCAAVQAMRVDDPSDTAIIRNMVPFSVAYRVGSGSGAPGHWFIVAEGSGSPVFPANASFNVMVDGKQAQRCLANAFPFSLFGDSFE